MPKLIDYGPFELVREAVVRGPWATEPRPSRCLASPRSPWTCPSGWTRWRSRWWSRCARFCASWPMTTRCERSCWPAPGAGSALAPTRAVRAGGCRARRDSPRRRWPCARWSCSRTSCWRCGRCTSRWSRPSTDPRSVAACAWPSQVER